LRFAVITMILAWALTVPGHVLPQGNENLLLQEIAGNIASYKKKTITLRLKLKGTDNIFDRITFYDGRNSEIDFDISVKEIRVRIEKDMLNLHDGMDYRVTFTVNDTGNLGHIIAELQGFKPVLLEKLP